MDYVYGHGSDSSNYIYVATNFMFADAFWNTQAVTDGYHDVYVRVCDQSNYCVIQSITVKVWNTTDMEEKEELAGVPERFSLSRNYPNPFNPTTTIPFTVASKQKTVNSPIHATLAIYNTLGQRVKTLVDETKTPGYYDVIWDGRDDKGEEVASGTYIYKLEADDFKQTKKMILLK